MVRATAIAGGFDDDGLTDAEKAEKKKMEDLFRAKVDARKRQQALAEFVAQAYANLQKKLARFGLVVDGSILLDDSGNISLNIPNPQPIPAKSLTAIPPDGVIRQMSRETLIEWLMVVRGRYRLKDIISEIGVTAPTIYAWSERRFLPEQHHREGIKNLLMKVRDGKF